MKTGFYYILKCELCEYKSKHTVHGHCIVDRYYVIDLECFKCGRVFEIGMRSSVAKIHPKPKQPDII